MNYKAPPGVFDIIPKAPNEKWRSSYLWDYLERKIQELANDYGFRRVHTPIFEKTELLNRGVGESSDIVTKEMYTFEDRGGRSMTLRPEGTAPLMRAFIENQLSQQGSLHKLYYIAPMFRYERSQAGRYRQHHQFGAEVIGSNAPETDAELIDMLFTLFKRLGISQLKVLLNSIGTKQTRENYRKNLIEYLEGHKKNLSEDSKIRFEKNPLRILDSKDEGDLAIVQNAPSILEFLDAASKKDFDRVQELLRSLDIPFTVSPLLVRGLDYYNNTVFEIVSTSLGAQNSIGGGGRYDGLIRELGGQDLPSVGFGAGLERILQTMINEGVALPEPPKTDLFLIPLGDEAKDLSWRIQKDLRSSHISVETDFSGRKLAKAMTYADQIGATYVAVIGEEEIKTGVIVLKEMATRTSYNIPIANLKRILLVDSKADSFVSLWQEMETPFANREESDFFLKKIQKNIQDTSKLSENLQLALEQIKGSLQP